MHSPTPGEMNKALLISLLVLVALTLSAHLPSQLHSTTPLPLNSNIQSQLDALAKRGFTYRFLDPTTVELTETWSGTKQVKSLKEPSEVEIRGWAAARGVPILEIDPTQVDTNQYAGWYTYFAEVPLSNSQGIPLVVSDLDRDGKADVYGAFHDFTSQDFEARVYEIDTNSVVEFGHNYVPRPGVSRATFDVDGDSLTEILWSFSGRIYDYEQPSSDSLPTQLRFVHERYQGNLTPGYTGIYVGFLDEDSLTDFLYKGSEPDSADTTIGIGKIYVAEFNYDSNNFVRVWSTQFVPGQQSTTAGFGVEDFERDGKMEFVATEGFNGRIFFTENTGDNTYAQVWQDSTPYVNLFFQTSGDVDGDGWPEFFVAATMSNGTWVLAYEADGDNSYSLRFVFHLLSAGVFDEPTLLTSDIDGDGRKELTILSGAWIHVFRSNADDDYSLMYLKRENNKDAIQTYDFDGDGRQDFIVSKSVIDSLNRGRYKADVYLGSVLVSVPKDVSSKLTALNVTNHPNPFNSATTIGYSLVNAQRVKVQICDILGRLVTQLLNETQPAGFYEITWNAEHIASGLYFCRIETSYSTVTRKMLLLR